jgi:hypothetical protein
MDLLYRVVSGTTAAAEHLTHTGIDHGAGCAYCAATAKAKLRQKERRDTRRAHPLSTDLITSGATPGRKRLLALSDGRPGAELLGPMHYAKHAETLPAACGSAALRAAVDRMCRGVTTGHSLVVLVEGVASVDWESMSPLERVDEPAASVLLLVAGSGAAADVPAAYSSATYSVGSDGAVSSRVLRPASHGAFRAVLVGGAGLLGQVDRLLASCHHRVTYSELLRRVPGVTLHVSRVGGDWHRNYVGMTLN